MQPATAPSALSAPENNIRYRMPFIWSICLVAAMGGLLFGYDWVVIGGAKPFYEKYFDLTTPFEIGWAMSSALAGCLAGAVLSGGLSDLYGRKRLLVASGALFLASAVGTALADSFSSFVIWRIVGGVAIGLASNLSPMYIAEVSPAFIRGRLVSVNQLTIVIGILLAQIVNLAIARPVPPDATTAEILASWNGQTGWRWMFGAEALPAAVFFLAMFFVPESPRWLAKNRRMDRARAVLESIGGAAHAEASLVEIGDTLRNETEKVRFSELFEPRMARIVLLGVVLAVFQQWCGINVIFNYAEEVFKAAGYGVSQMLMSIVITGVTNLVFTFVAIALVDRFGRKILMLAGSAGLAGTYALMGLGYHFESRGLHMLVLVMVAIAFYSCSLAPVTWVLLSEIFPNRIRGAAMSVGVFSLWMGCLTLTFSFPYLNSGLGPAGTFWGYALVCLLGFLYVWKKVPETRGATLEEIERRLLGN